MKVSTFKSLSNLDIQKIIKSGKHRRSAGFCAWFMPKLHTHHRIACALSKHKLGQASKRNRVRRVIKEYIKLNRENFLAYDWVIGLENKWDVFPSKKLLWQQLKQFFGAV